MGAAKGRLCRPAPRRLLAEQPLGEAAQLIERIAVAIAVQEAAELPQYRLRSAKLAQQMLQRIRRHAMFGRRLCQCRHALDEFFRGSGEA